MKLNVKLTADELQNVLDAAANEALDNGLLYDDNEDDMSCLFAAVDAALTAMGISISIDGEPKVEDENKYCDSAADCYFCNSDDDSEEEVDAFGLPMDYWSEFDKNNDADENTEHDDSCRYSLTAKGEFVVRYMEAGYTFEEACKIADLLFGEGRSE